MADYRLLTREEWPTAVKLWVQVFEVEALFFESLIDGGDDDDFSVGAFDGGELIASVHVFMRHFRDRSGTPLKVGGIGSVSTRQERRKEGHSGKLLQMATQRMDERGCIWSYLGTGVNNHYARYGWRTVSTPFFKGNIRPDLKCERAEPQEVTPELLAEIAPVHEAFTRTRPMMNSRSAKLWQTAVRYRITRPGDQVLVHSVGQELAAYLVCHQQQDYLQLVEGACVLGHESDLGGLVGIALGSAEKSGIRVAVATLPEDSPTFAAFAMCCEELVPMEERGAMLKPIANRIPWPELMAIHGDPRGRRSDLDAF